MGAEQSDNNQLAGFCCNNALCNNDSNIENKGNIDQSGFRKNNFRKAGHTSN
jgi:hypothetical protein